MYKNRFMQSNTQTTLLLGLCFALLISLFNFTTLPGFYSKNGKLQIASSHNLTSSFSASVSQKQGQISPELFAAHAQTIQNNAPAEYHFVATPNGYQAANPAHNLAVNFGQNGANFEKSWQLQFAGLNTSDGLLIQKAASVWPVATANRVEYRRGELTEWYLNGALGLEQGFTFARAPQAAADGFLRLEMRLQAATAESSNAQSAFIKTADGRTWQYSNLHSWDAAGQTLSSRLEVAANGSILRLVVDARAAAYPVTVDPFFTQVQEISQSPDTAPTKYFGESTALSADGNLAVIGGGGALNIAGGVYIYTRNPNSGTFSQTQVLTSTDSASADGFGIKVKLSKDGNYLFVGAPVKKINNAEVGAVYIYTRTVGTNTFSQTQIITNTIGQDLENFGLSLAFAETGKLLLVGAPAYGSFQSQGRVFVFQQNNLTGIFSQTQILSPNDTAPYDYFASDVAIDDAGTTAFVSAPKTNVASKVSSVYIFTRPQNSITFTQSQVLTATEPDAYLGNSLAFSTDGNVLAVGGGTSLSLNHNARTYLFSRNLATNSYVQTQVFTLDPNTYNCLVALSGDGNTLTCIIGDNSLPTTPRAVFTFLRQDNTKPFAPSQTLTVNDSGVTRTFGSNVSLSYSGRVLLFGVGEFVVNAQNQPGKVFVFTGSEAAQVSISASPSVTNVGQPVTFTATVTGEQGTVPTGTVTFYVENQPVYTVTLPAGPNPTVTYTTSNLPAGQPKVYARYNGGNLPAINSALAMITIAKFGSAISLTSSPNPALLGQSIVFTASVVPTAATGTVTFTIGANSVATPLTNGVATYLTNTLSAGVYSVTATYGGSAIYSSSVSTVYTQVVVAPCNPLLVTAITDDGAAINCGTFSYALSQATNGQTISFALTSGSIITFTGSLSPTVPAGVTVDGGATGVLLEGNRIMGDGLRLTSNTTLRNLTVAHFAGRELVINGGGNRLERVRLLN